MDIYDALIGSAPTDPERQAALAAQLRRRRSFGELGALTGDRVLQPFGQNLARSADSYAGQVQDIRQKDIDNAQTKAYQTGQLDHMGNVLTETTRNNTLDFIAAMALADAARIRAEKPTGVRQPKLRQGDINFLRENSTALGTIRGTLDFMDKGGKMGAVEMGGVPIPLLRQTLNTAARMGFGTDESKDSQLQLQNYKRFYELAQRNALFGATLTPNEMRAWESANPSIAQTDEQIRKGLEIMQRIYEHASNSYAGGLEEEGYSPDAIARYRSVTPVSVSPAEGAPEAIAGAEEAPAPASGELTPEEAAELAFLKKKYGR